MSEALAQGRIVKGISGFYYVYVVGSGIYECKAKGAFRNQNIKPLVGDNVRIAIVDEEAKTGNVEEILPRHSELVRPNVSNVDQALVIFAATKPKPNLNLLDRFLVMMEYQNLETIVCFNKVDLCKKEEDTKLKEIYEAAGYRVILTSVKAETGLTELEEVLKGKTTTVAGPSGVGKSSLTNMLQEHTTRHSELIAICPEENTYIMDTPGFSSMFTPELEKEDLQWYFPEFEKHTGNCKFQPCCHINEPDCGVKRALEAGLIMKSRYNNYLLLFDEIKNKKKY